MLFFGNTIRIGDREVQSKGREELLVEGRKTMMFHVHDGICVLVPAIVGVDMNGKHSRYSKDEKSEKEKVGDNVRKESRF
jgi:hypothetical protein